MYNLNLSFSHRHWYIIFALTDINPKKKYWTKTITYWVLYTNHPSNVRLNFYFGIILSHMKNECTRSRYFQNYTLIPYTYRYYVSKTHIVNFN